MSLYRRGRIWHYDFQVNGRRYFGTTKQTTETKAKQVEIRKMQEAQESGYALLPRKAPILRDFAETALKSIKKSNLDPDTKRYYQNGWNRIATTPLAGMRLNHITTETISAVQFDGSPSWQNQALRTLSVLLARAVEAHYLHTKPRVRLAKESRRETVIDDAAETKLLESAKQPLRDVLTIMRDGGMRPEEVFRMRWEYVDWERRFYFNPYGKTPKARRRVPLSQRVVDALKARAKNGSAWVFPSKRAKGGHLTTVAKQFRQARELAGLADGVKLYGARHDFGTYAVEATGNVFAVRDVMGHEDIKTTAIYQHPELNAIRDAIDERNNRRVM